MIQFNPNVNAAFAKPNINGAAESPVKTPGSKPGFSDVVKAAEDQLQKVNTLQQQSDVSIQDLLTGKNEDITSVVSSMAKADMSFKLLVGVRNKLVEAYKETMNMPL